jgi:hypothetical protein
MNPAMLPGTLVSWKSIPWCPSLAIKELSM